MRAILSMSCVFVLIISTQSQLLLPKLINAHSQIIMPKLSSTISTFKHLASDIGLIKTTAQTGNFANNNHQHHYQTNPYQTYPNPTYPNPTIPTPNNVNTNYQIDLRSSIPSEHQIVNNYETHDHTLPNVAYDKKPSDVSEGKPKSGLKPENNPEGKLNSRLKPESGAGKVEQNSNQSSSNKNNVTAVHKDGTVVFPEDDHSPDATPVNVNKSRVCIAGKVYPPSDPCGKTFDAAVKVCEDGATLDENNKCRPTDF